MFNTCKQRFRLLDNHRVGLRPDPHNNNVISSIIKTTASINILLLSKLSLILCNFVNHYAYGFGLLVIVTRAYQRWGQRGQFAPGPQCKGTPQILKRKKKFGTFFDINIGLRKNFLNLNFADIGPKVLCQCNLRRICPKKKCY
jgi:hypothetical protein